METGFINVHLVALWVLRGGSYVLFLYKGLSLGMLRQTLSFLGYLVAYL
jgi:hypothetical protein